MCRPECGRVRRGCARGVHARCRGAASLGVVEGVREVCAFTGEQNKVLFLGLA